MRSMFILKPFDENVVEQDVKVTQVKERDIAIKDGDEIVCLVAGVARRYGNTPEIEIREARLVKVVEVRTRK